ncbi:MAG: OsmC family protein [Bacillota bacterium]
MDPLTRVVLTWHGDDRFAGVGDSGKPVLINFGTAAPRGEPVPPLPPPDPAREPSAGPYPTELLLIAVGACTGLDVVSLLGKKRVPFSGLEIEVTGTRAASHPRCFTGLDLVYRLEASPEALTALERAAALSLERYCSVSHSLRVRPAWRCEVRPGAPDSPRRGDPTPGPGG